MAAKDVIKTRKVALLEKASGARYLVEWAKITCFGGFLVPIVFLLGRVPQAPFLIMLAGGGYVLTVLKEQDETGTLKPFPIKRWQLSDMEREAIGIGDDDTNLESNISYLPRREQVEYLLLDAHGGIVSSWLDRIPSPLVEERLEDLVTEFNYQVGEAIQRHPHLIKGCASDLHEAIVTVDTQAALTAVGTPKSFAPAARRIDIQPAKRAEPVTPPASEAPVVDVVGFEADLENCEEW